MRLLRKAALRIKPFRRLYEARDALLRERNDLAAQLANGTRSPFFHYNASFDPQEVMRRHAARDLMPTPGYLTNFLGVLIDPKYFPTILQGREGQVEGIPIPANWHADIAEWGAVLRAVDLARETFTVVELGCGWGCWMNNTGLAARRAGLDVHLVGVEGDEGHAAFALESCAVNGFKSNQVTIHRGVAAATSGVALFPRQEQAGLNWGLEPIFGATEEQRRCAVRSGTHYEVPMVPLDQVAAADARIDLLHVDIQGGEADLIATSLSVLREKVAYLVVGTHSRQIEGRIIETLLGDSWVMEIERPAILALDARCPTVTVDGVQGWRNPRFRHYENVAADRAAGSEANDSVCAKVAFASLIRAANRYVAEGLPLVKLDPWEAQHLHLLDLPGCERSGPSQDRHWWKNLWLGAWSESLVAAGIVGDYQDLAPLVDIYQSDTADVFFPYPSRLVEGCKTGTGQLLIVFTVEGLRTAAMKTGNTDT